MPLPRGDFDGTGHTETGEIESILSDLLPDVELDTRYSEPLQVRFYRGLDLTTSPSPRFTPPRLARLARLACPAVTGWCPSPLSFLLPTATGQNVDRSQEHLPLRSAIGQNNPLTVHTLILHPALMLIFLTVQALVAPMAPSGLDCGGGSDLQHEVPDVCAFTEFGGVEVPRVKKRRKQVPVPFEKRDEACKDLDTPLTSTRRSPRPADHSPGTRISNFARVGPAVVGTA